MKKKKKLNSAAETLILLCNQEYITFHCQRILTSLRLLLLCGSTPECHGKSLNVYPEDVDEAPGKAEQLAIKLRKVATMQ